MNFKIFMWCQVFTIFLVDSSNLSDKNSCESGDFCVRLCCSLNNPKLECSNLTLMPEKRKLPTNYTIIKGKPCSVMMLEEDDTWMFSENSTIIFSDAKVPPHTIDHYCISGLNSTHSHVSLSFCEDESDDTEGVKTVKALYSYFMIASIPFLVVTLLIYGLLKELRNLHGKCLMSYCVGLLLIYICLIAKEFGKNSWFQINWICKSSGYVEYASFLTCFLWLNVMCFDIWSTFRRTSGGHKNNKKLFINYSLYAFGCPVLICLFVYIFNEATMKGESRYCSLNHPEAFATTFLFGVVACVIFFNILFYTITAYKIFQVQRELSAVQKSDNRQTRMGENRSRFFLYLRLFILMGIIWTIELVSYAFENSFIAHVLDIFNCLQGVLIFSLYIWKPKVRTLIINRYSTISSSFSKRWTLRTDSPNLSHTYASQLSASPRPNSDNITMNNLMLET